MPQNASRLLFVSAVALFSLVVCPGNLLAGGEGWTHDMKAAMKQAAKEDKDLLMDFTGSDWCGWCIRLNREVFDTDAFKKEAPKHFVLVELDFPRDQSKLSAETKKQNTEWQQKLGVQGYPTIFLADEKGRPYARTGYQAGGAESYLKHLGELRQIREKRDKAFKRAEKADGLEKAKAFDEALEAVGEELAYASYGKTVEKIIELDVDNEAGLRSKYLARQHTAEVQKLIREVQQEYNGENADAMLAKLDKAAEKYSKSPAARTELGLFKVALLGAADRSDEALKLISSLLEEKGLEPRQKVQLTFQKAHMLGQKGKDEEALKAYDDALSGGDLGRHEFRLHIGRAELLAKAGRKEEAAKAFDAAVAAADDENLKKQIRNFRGQVLGEDS
jgi:thioredoxin-related protein